MQKILIVNFRKNGDLLASSHLLHSLKNMYPGAEIALVIYKEFFKAAQTLKHLSNIYTIDRHEIVTFKKGKIFSEAHALNSFNNIVSEIKAQTWDLVINLSYDLLSSYFLSALNVTPFMGMREKPRGGHDYSSIWALLFNEVIPSYPFTPIHYVDFYHEMTEIPFVEDEIKVISNPTNNKQAYENFCLLKKRIGSNKKVVGIQIKTGSVERDLPTPLLVDLLKMMLKSSDYYPVLLIAPNREEREKSNQLNRYFDSELVSIESDFLALPSVLINIDFLITPDTAIKHMADSVKTPLIEISLGKAPMRKQGTYNIGNLILKSETASLEASDIFEALQFYHKERARHHLSLSEGVTLFGTQRDSLGIWYEYISGTSDVFSEISVLMSRFYLSQLTKKSSTHDQILHTIIKTYSHQEIYNWMDREKESITETVKQLLQNLSILRGLKIHPQRSKELVLGLEGILGFCERPTLSAIACGLFRGRLETLESNSIESNIRDMEKLLFQLKEHLHLLTIALTHLTSLEYRYRQEELGVKAQPNSP